MSQTVTTIEQPEEKSKRGGYRVNAGRKPGSIGKKQQALKKLTNKIIEQDHVPLRTMINNMVHYDEKARTLTEALSDKLFECKDQMSPEQLLEALKLVAQIGDARMHAQKCAVDAAPYVHPKLSAVSMEVKQTEHIRDINEDDNVSTFADDYRKLRSQPFIIEQADVEVEAEENS